MSTLNFFSIASKQPLYCVTLPLLGRIESQSLQIFTQFFSIKEPDIFILCVFVASSVTCHIFWDLKLSSSGFDPLHLVFFLLFCSHKGILSNIHWAYSFFFLKIRGFQWQRFIHLVLIRAKFIVGQKNVVLFDSIEIIEMLKQGCLERSHFTWH